MLILKKNAFPKFLGCLEKLQSLSKVFCERIWWGRGSTRQLPLIPPMLTGIHIVLLSHNSTEKEQIAYNSFAARLLKQLSDVTENINNSFEPSISDPVYL